MQILYVIFASLIILLLIIVAIVGLGFYFIHNRRTRFREDRSLNSVLLHVLVPRTNEVKIDAMEQLIGALASIKESGWETRFKTQPVISFEIVAKPEEIKFYVWTHTEFRELLERQIHGAYPEAEINQVDEYEIFTHDGKVAYKSFQLNKENYFPLKTYKDIPTDPLSTITAALAKMQLGEAAAIQVLISPTNSDWQNSGKSYISDTKQSQSDPEKVDYSVSGKTLEAVENKIMKPGFETSIRIVVVSPTEAQANSHLANLSSAFALFSSDLNSFTGRGIRQKGSFVEDFIYRYHPLMYLFGKRKMILTPDEIGTIFHFPNKLITTPHINWLTAKSAPPPGNLPTEGLFIGTSTYRNQEKKVYIGPEDRMRHMYIVGKTGTGKTQFLVELMKQDIKAGHGLCFIDPHGDAVEDLLEFIPPERAEDVIYFKPSDVERPMGLNLMAAKTEDQKHFVAAAIINMMYKLFDPYKTGIVGPRFEHTVRNAILTVLSEEGNSFIEVYRVLTDSNYVKELLPKVADPVVRRFWTDQIAQTSDFHKSETLDYITSKFGRFISNAMIRNIIGQSNSSFDFRKVMDEQKILLINLSKGELGEENSNFLGLILVPRILMAAMSRADVPEEQRKDFFLYVDEFQNFATPDFAQILSEARKYRLALIVANQFIGQLDQELKDAIFGNVGTVISYRVGVDDANYLAKQFQPVFNEEDLQNIAKYHIYMKTLVGNEQTTPFSVSLKKDMDEIKRSMNPKVAEVIKEMSRLKYGRDRKLVELEILRRSKL